MRRWAMWLLFVSASAATLAMGCAHRRGHDDGCVVLPSMPIVGQGHLEPNPQTIRAPSGREQPLLAVPAAYRELSAAQVQCLAASNASLSDLVMREREMNEPRCPIVSVVRIHRKQQERTRNCILEYSAQELQNQ